METRALHSVQAGKDHANAPQLDFKLIAGWCAAVTCPALLFAVCQWVGMTFHASLFVALGGLVITMWIFTLVDHFIPPLLATACLLFIDLAPPAVALSSFSSPSFITLLSVFALAAMIQSSGLSHRMLLWLQLRLPESPFWHQLSLMLYGLVLSLGTPSTNNRMALILPAFEGMSRSLRLPSGSASLTALFAAAYAGATLFSTTLATSKTASISVIAALPPHMQAQYTGMYWLTAASVSTGLLFVAHLLASRWVFADTVRHQGPEADMSEQLRSLGPMRSAEKLTLVAFLILLTGSMSTAWHHVAPSAVAGMVLSIVLVTGVMSKSDFQKNIDWPMIIFLMSCDSLTKVMGHLGLSDDLAAFLRDRFTFIQGDVTVFILSSLALVVFIRFFLPIVPSMLVSAMILLPVAQNEGIHLWLAVFVIAIFSDIWFFRYQNNVYLMAFNAGVIDRMDESAFMRHNLMMNLARILAVFASLPLWHGLSIA